MNCFKNSVSGELHIHMFLLLFPFKYITDFSTSQVELPHSHCNGAFKNVPRLGGAYCQSHMAIIVESSEHIWY